MRADVYVGQIAFALRRAEIGTAVEEICRKMTVSEPTFYQWKKQFPGMGVAELCRLKRLEEENAKLKRARRRPDAQQDDVAGFGPLAPSVR